ncbi:hypothetical protein ACFYYY_19265 [Streptomyces sp. NPDC001834]|uniref:hypothetical protein n=1 Tax=unclassified Streptomyces TaxID=2593676 RepID=UPI003417E06A
MVGHVRAGALAGAALLLTGLLAGCGTGDDGKQAEGTDRGSASTPSHEGARSPRGSG